MCNRRKLFFATLCAFLAVIALAACGGGGSGGGTGTTVSPATSQTAVVEGIAAAGAPLSGTVSLSDSSFPTKELTAPINQDGTFFIDVAGLKAPFILKGVGVAGNSWYSFAKAPGIAHINPLTTLALAMAAGATDQQSLADLYATHNVAVLQGVAANLPRAAADINSALGPLFSLCGAADADPLGGPYTVNGQGLDGMFDRVGINIAGGMVTVTRKDTLATVFNAPVDNVTSGAIDTAAMPAPPRYAMPGNAVVTLKLQGELAQGTRVKNLSLAVQLPLGVTVDTGPSGVNTAIPTGAARDANVYPQPSLSATNNILKITMSSLAGFGAGEFLTVRCLVSSALLLQSLAAADFMITSADMYADIYKKDRLSGLTIAPVGISYPAAEGKKIYDSLCARCHTLDPSDTVITPTLFDKTALLPDKFRTAHHGVTLTVDQLDNLRAYLDDYYQGRQTLIPR